jgi:branched-chain amino acid transport system substrate-binding protein
LIAGCGADEGVDRNATLNVYVSAPLCAGATKRLEQEGPKVDSVRLRVICLDSTESSKKMNLAAIGANARRAVEDSSSIAYIGDPTPAATKFSQPILEAAGIPQLANQPGAAAMTKLLRALRGAGDSSSLREAVADELQQR